MTPLQGIKKGIHKISRQDAVWILALPAYLTLGTIRHEASHALVVLLEGGAVNKFVFWPTWEEKFYFGYVQWSGSVDWLVSASPYFVDVFTFALFFLICTKMPIRRHWIWVNLYALGILSPLVNSGYRYISNFFRTGDLTKVAVSVPSSVIHAYFLLTVSVYVLGILWIQRRGSTE